MKQGDFVGVDSISWVDNSVAVADAIIIVGFEELGELSEVPTVGEDRLPSGSMTVGEGLGTASNEDRVGNCW